MLACQGTPCHSLATIPASQNQSVKKEIIAALERIAAACAGPGDAIRLLESDRTTALRASRSGMGVARSADYEAKRLFSVLTDLIQVPVMVRDRFEIRYDVSRLLPDQRSMVEAYIDRLGVVIGSERLIRRRPFISRDGAVTPVIAVRRNGSDTGDGAVDISGGGPVGAAEADIIGMLNVAVAAAIIPNDATANDAGRYQPLLQYIAEQYALLAERDFPVMAGHAAELSAIRTITLPPLPSAERHDPGRTKPALSAA